MRIRRELQVDREIEFSPSPFLLASLVHKAFRFEDRQRPLLDARVAEEVAVLLLADRILVALERCSAERIGVDHTTRLTRLEKSLRYMKEKEE